MSRRLLQTLAGAVLACVSAFGAVHGVRAAMAQRLYDAAKYGASAGHTGAVLQLCREADGLYPYNYYFCMLAAQDAFDAGRREDASYWCERGLALNVYRRPLRVLKTYLLAGTSIDQSIAYWAVYLDWQFWDAFNHAVMFRLRLHAGDYAGAMAETAWLKDSSYLDDARQRLRDAWQRERTPPAGVAPPSRVAPR